MVGARDAERMSPLAVEGSQSEQSGGKKVWCCPSCIIADGKGREEKENSVL